MQLSNRQEASWRVRRAIEDAILLPPPIPPAPSSMEDPEARQSRKLALMAALSEGLPTLPAYVFELNSLLAATPVNLKRVAEVIRTDPSLDGAGSATVQFRVHGLSRASYEDRARGHAGGNRKAPDDGPDLLAGRVRGASGGIGGHSIVLAALLPHGGAQRKACPRRSRYPQPEQAYLGGLLHDIGALPLLVVTSAESQSAENLTTFGWGESVELEREHFGTDHCEVGHWIGVSWNFPPAFWKSW